MTSTNDVLLRTHSGVGDGRPTKVLLADDDRLCRLVLQQWLQNWGYEVVTGADGDEAWQIMQQVDAPQLLILDWMMPGVEGLQLCQRVRQLGRLPYPYILLLTAKDHKEDIIRALDGGADDYLTKPCEMEELRARVGVGKRFIELQQELLHTQEELRYGATHDALTGVWNRAGILALLARELERANRSRISLGVMMVDIDHFKRINDTYGHVAGDRVLNEVISRIVNSLRSYDLIGRYGGEEFLVLLSDFQSLTIERSAERIRRSVAEAPVAIGPEQVDITVSIGVALSERHDEIADHLLAAADAALYAAKNNGRNRVEVGIMGIPTEK